MLHIPILRHGKPYESIDKIEIVHHATGEPVAQVSQANAGLISRDIRADGRRRARAVHGRGADRDVQEGRPSCS